MPNNEKILEKLNFNEDIFWNIYKKAANKHLLAKNLLVVTWWSKSTIPLTIGAIQKGRHHKNGNFWTPPLMSALVTISGYPPPSCHRVNSDKSSLRIQVMETNSKNYDKFAEF